MIQPHNWLIMKQKCPGSMHQLISNCYEYEEEMAYLDTVKTIAGRDIGKIQILIQRIMTEYMKVIQTTEKDEIILGKIRDDIKSTLSNWFDSKGNIKDLSGQFIMSMERNQLNFHLPLFATPSTGFIHSRIYQSLLEAYNYSISMNYFKVNELKKFVPDKNWMSIGKKIYPNLCMACKNYEEYVEYIQRMGISANKNMMAKLDEKWLIVVEEYLKIVQGKDKILMSITNYEQCNQFINAVYSNLYEAKDKQEGTFNNQFVNSSKLKAGIFPEIYRKEGSGFDGIKLPKGPPP